MSKNKVLDTALSIIDKHIHLSHKEIARKIYAETGYCDQDYNKFLAVVSSGDLTLREYIRKRRLYFAVCELINNPKKSLADIAQDYGYSDQSAFSRAVKKEYRNTPAEIRKSKGDIPDVRKVLEHHLSNKSRLDSIFEKLKSDNLSNSDWHYFEDFIHATDEFGFDTSTCCLISELSEKLSIPFGYLIEQCFEMAIECNQDDWQRVDEIIECMRDLRIENEEELEELCRHFNCKWYDLELVPVQMYRLGIDTEEELEKIWNYYDCNRKWTSLDVYPLTKQMVQDYRNRHKS